MRTDRSEELTHRSVWAEAWLLAALVAVGGCSEPGRTQATAGAGRVETATVALDANQIVGIKVLCGEPAARDILIKQGFVISGQSWPSIVACYLSTPVDPCSLAADYRRLRDSGVDSMELMVSGAETLKKQFIPPFVTTDAMLYAYQEILADEIKDLELSQVELMRNWQNFCASELGYHGAHSEVDANSPAVRALGLFKTGGWLLDPNWQPDSRDASTPAWAGKEAKLLIDNAGPFRSVGWGRRLESSAFVPRGIYAKDRSLAAYFRARTWWSRYPLRMDKPEELALAVKLVGLHKLMAVPSRKGVFLDDLFNRMGRDDMGEPDRSYWRLCSPYRYLLGRAEDPSLMDFGRAAGEQMKEGSMFDGAFELASDPNWTLAVRTLMHRFHPSIRTGDAPDELVEPGEPQVYVFPPAYVFGSEVFTRTTDLKRNLARMPGGLDVMAALGSDCAKTLLLHAAAPTQRKALAEATDESRARWHATDLIAEVTRHTHRVMMTLAEPELTAGHPAFMRTGAYRRKGLQTALAGWALHRHLWVLHAKGSSGIFGSRAMLKAPPGFVEPNVEFWKALLDLTILTRSALKRCGGQPGGALDKLAEALLRCRSIAEKQLANKPLSGEEQLFLEGFSETLQGLCNPGAGDVPRSIIADVYRETLFRKVVHAGLGQPQEIFVVYPHAGRLWLCKGGAVIYREHVTTDGQVVTGSQWWQLQSKVPQPAWTKDFCLPPVEEQVRSPFYGE